MPFLSHIDFPSFWIGVGVASFVWILALIARPLLNQLWENNRAQNKERQAKPVSGMEENHRKVVCRRAQAMHLASSLFALDEIVEKPLLLAPTASIEPGMQYPVEDIVDQAVPYLPGWPELASIYRGRTMTIPEALSGGMNLVITGQPGTGKSVALAYLASQISRKSQEVGDLKETIPFLLHAADLGLPIPEPQRAEDLLKPISEFVASTAPVFSIARVPGFILYAFQSERALLLLDGLDELPQSAIQDTTNYLKLLLKAFPKTRVITTGAPEYVDGILSLGFAALSLMPWSEEQQLEFLTKWSDLWQRFVSVEAWAQAISQPIDPLILHRWLSTDNQGLTPLEFTLKIWSAFAGDTLGSRPIDAIESHVRRLLPGNVSPEALYVLGAQASSNGQSIFDSRTAGAWVRSFESAESTAAGDETAAETTDETKEKQEEEPAIEESKKSTAKGQATPSVGAGLLSKLVSTGLLVNHVGNRMRFANPVLMGYLAGRGLSTASNPENLINQPVWSGQIITLRYLAAFADVSSILNTLLSQEDKLLCRPQITSARLLREAPRNASWKGSIMTCLIQLIQDEDLPIGLRGQAMAAFATSGDPGVPALFRQLLSAPSSELRRLAALGTGYVKDPKAVEALINQLSQSVGPSRQAACLALVEIGIPQALEAVATGLLHGDEDLRRTAAEALANHPTEGREALREGITSEDILVRRAIVYGLGRVDEPWAVQMLEQIQVQDEQWVVRNVAVELLDSKHQINPRIPRRLTQPAQTPWVVEYAGKHGMGVIPGQPSTDIFLLALKDENIEYKLAALNYLRYLPSDGVFSAIYQLYYGPDAEIKEAIFRIFSDLAMGGTNLPHPMKFGLG